MYFTKFVSWVISVRILIVPCVFKSIIQVLNYNLLNLLLLLNTNEYCCCSVLLFKTEELRFEFINILFELQLLSTWDTAVKARIQIEFVNYAISEILGLTKHLQHIKMFHLRTLYSGHWSDVVSLKLKPQIFCYKTNYCAKLR